MYQPKLVTVFFLSILVFLTNWAYAHAEEEPPFSEIKQIDIMGSSSLWLFVYEGDIQNCELGFIHSQIHSPVEVKECIGRVGMTRECPTFSVKNGQIRVMLPNALVYVLEEDTWGFIKGGYLTSTTEKTFKTSPFYD